MSGQANQNNTSAPSLCRDTMELLFRNALANESLSGTGAFMKRITMSSQKARDPLVRVTRRFRTAVFTPAKITLIRDQETAAVSVSQFAWLLRTDMLRFVTFEIACNSSNGCNTLSREPHMPTLRKLKCSGVDWWREATKSRASFGASQLAAAIVRSNKSTLKVLDGLPISTFNEALPALDLDTFVFKPVPTHSISLTKLDRCSIYVFEYDASRYYPGHVRLSLEPLANLNATEIFWKFSHLIGFEELTTPATNNHVEIVCLEAERLMLRTSDIDQLLLFFPKLAVLDICANFEVTKTIGWWRNWWTLAKIKHHLSRTHGTRPLQVKLHSAIHFTVAENIEWTAQNVQKFILKQRDQLSDMSQESHGISGLVNFYATFHRVSESDTKDADEKAAELGLRREDVNGATTYKGKIDLSPDAAANFEYTVL